MQGVGQVREGIHGHPQDHRVRVRAQENQEGFSALHARPVRAVSQDSDVLEPPEAGKSVWLLR